MDVTYSNSTALGSGVQNFFRDVFSLVGLLVSVYWSVVVLAKTSKKIGDSNVVKVPLVMIKSIYTKTCPIINWK